MAEIIEARLSEILDFVNDELKRIGRAGRVPAGVHLYGGGAELPYLGQLVKKELKLAVRKAYLDQYSRYFNRQVEPKFYGVASLLVWYLDSVVGEKRMFYSSGFFGWFRRLFENLRG